MGIIRARLTARSLGKVITLYHDTNNPGPYSRIHIVQGTAGLFEKYPDRVYIEGRSKNDQWDTLDAYAEFEHPLWTAQADKARGTAGWTTSRTSG